MLNKNIVQQRYIYREEVNNLHPIYTLPSIRAKYKIDKDNII